MSIRKTFSRLFLFALLGVVAANSNAADEKTSVTLYTPYTQISVPPGQSIKYTIELINNTPNVLDDNIRITGLPRSWDYSLKSGNYNIEQLAVLPGDKKTFTLDVQVPLKVNKGNYHFTVSAGADNQLPLTVTVSKQGTFKTEFTTDQANMSGHSNSSFTFKANLNNSTDDKQVYALEAHSPRGWDVTFKANYKEVASVNVDENSTKDVTIEIKPPAEVEAGRYKIPVTAATNGMTSQLNLEVVITGSYGMEMSTPTGLLSTKVTAGDERTLDLVIRNTGTAPLEDIKLSSAKPSDWDVSFDPNAVIRIEPGQKMTVHAKVKASKNAIAGDYVAKITAKTPEATSNAEFRISVRTPTILGGMGILVIMLALGSVTFLFRKYGRR
ncbi:COG1470 family protein [Mangrovibacterium diazotrophicum]|uniref:Putative membrane protein n=1 Tax=Mangrovibacterium diazotrophicum TaxID=1261403 RepID=A0A419W6U4_9BACT|nr:NEW3 domain-containing protein [Mangrovibacterium diazotrophicum]RKD91150.1 putative membrane protein [Mangrovibacterium diazotrophicum]